MSVAAGVFTKETVIDGKTARVKCVDIGGQTFVLSPGLATVVRVEDDWYDDVNDPHAVVAGLQRSRTRADVFTFWQRLPQIEPRFDFHTEWESIAALPVTTFNHWLSAQIKPTARNKIRKASKLGVEVREPHYDDGFVRGMTDIFNETPIRQGRRFWHYGKDFKTVKEQFSRCLFREDLLAAYYEDELIGFAMLGHAGTYGFLGQIISKIRHRDKAPNNALVAKAVDVCERRKLPYLVYANWVDGSLMEFKRANGFEEIRLPRYYVPLTRWGEFVIAAGLHKGWKSRLPTGLKTRLKAVRSRWLGRAAQA